MARFPRIQSPCPIANELADYMDGNACRRCHRQVHDLTAMGDEERREFMAGCHTEVCVSYRQPVKAALGAALIASSFGVAAVTPPANAGTDEFATEQPAWLSEAATESVQDCDSMEVIIVGGIKAPDKVDYIELDEETDLPALTVVYEDA